MTIHENITSGREAFHQKFGSLNKTDIGIATGFTLVAAIILTPGLGLQSLANWDEITRELLNRPGLTLRYEDRLWFEKPSDRSSRRFG
jgi:hypothetical protein